MLQNVYFQQLPDKTGSFFWAKNMLERQTEHPFEQYSIVAGQIVQTDLVMPLFPKETTELLTGECEPIAAVTFDEIMSSYPSFLVSLGIDRVSANLEAFKMKRSFHERDPYQKAVMIEALNKVDNARRELKNSNSNISGTLETSGQLPGLSQTQPISLDAGRPHYISEAAGK